MKLREISLNYVNLRIKETWRNKRNKPSWTQVNKIVEQFCYALFILQRLRNKLYINHASWHRCLRSGGLRTVKIEMRSGGLRTVKIEMLKKKQNKVDLVALNNTNIFERKKTNWLR